MRRNVIDLDRDLPARATPLTRGALERVFGGDAPCSSEGFMCGFMLRCCGGLACRSTMVFGMPLSRCVAS